MTIQRIADAGPVVEEWDELADRLQAPPWMRPGWFAAWNSCFAGQEMTLLCCRRAGELVGILPIESRRHEIRSPTNGESPGFQMLAVDGDAAGEVSEALLSGPGSRYTLFPFTVDAFGSNVLLDLAAQKGLLISSRIVAHSPFLRTEETWDEYLERRGTAPFREERRKRRMLSREGHLTFEVLDGRKDLDRLFNQALAVEAEGWKGKRQTAIALRPDSLRFYRSLAYWGAERGWLRLNFLRLNGQGIAFDLSFECEGVSYLFKTSYDPSLRRMSPGIVLRYETIKRAFDGEVTRYEFLGKAEPFKLKWADGFHEQLLVHGFAPSLIGRTEYAAYRYLGPIKRTLGRKGGSDPRTLAGGQGETDSFSS